MMKRKPMQSAAMEFKVALTLALWILLNCSGCNGDGVSGARKCQFHHYYNSLERALLNTTENLYKLQQMFLPTATLLNGATVLDKVGFRICLENRIQATNTTDHTWVNGTESTSYAHTCWNYVWSSSLLYSLVTTRDFDNMIGMMVHKIALRDRTAAHHVSSEGHSLRLHYKQEQCDIDSQDVFKEAINTLASWVMAYAKARGQPNSWSKEDHGYVTRWCGYSYIQGLDNFNSPHVLRIALLVTFVILNVTSFFFVAKFALQYYNGLAGACRNSTYQAIVAVAIMFCGLLAWSVVSYAVQVFYLKSKIKNPDWTAYPYCGRGSYKDHTTFLTVYVTLIPTLVLLELLIAARATRSRRSVRGRTPCRLCCTVLDTLALWSILVFIRVLTISAIPIILMMLYTPARTLSTCVVLAIVVLSVVIVMTRAIEFCSCFVAQRALPPPEWKAKLLRLILTLLLLSLTNALLIIYLELLRGVSGWLHKLMFSLIPSIILSAVGWSARKLLFSSNKRQISGQTEPDRRSDESMQQLV